MTRHKNCFRVATTVSTNRRVVNAWGRPGSDRACKAVITSGLNKCIVTLTHILSLSGTTQN